MEIPKSKQPNNYVIFLLFLDILHFFFFNGTLTFYLNYIYHKGGGYPGLPSPSCLCLENALNPTVLGHASNSMASR